MDKKHMIDIMNKEMVVALGCTDPISISYAAAVARHYARSGDIQHIKVRLSLSVIKNAASVIIPGTSVCGVPMAAILGALYGDPDGKLEVLKGINPSCVPKAQTLLDQGVCTVEEAKNGIQLYVEVTIVTTEVDEAKVALANDYTNVVLIEHNGELVKNETCEPCTRCPDGSQSTLCLDSIWEFINTADVETDLSHVADSIKLNECIACEGLEHPYGLKVGKTLKENMDSGILEKNLMNIAVSWTAAGADARMAGCCMPVMSCSGSGNQGITATMPVVAIANALEAGEEKKLRAVALSNLVTIYIKEFFGRISVLCGASMAAAGASCGIVYLLGGGLTEMRSAIQNMIGNVTGVICDGAKVGCALKVSTCVQAAVQAALLAMKGIEIKDTDGIIGHSVEDTLRNLAKVSKDSSGVLNQTIVNIMISK